MWHVISARDNFLEQLTRLSTHKYNPTKKSRYFLNILFAISSKRAKSMEIRIFLKLY